MGHDGPEFHYTSTPLGGVPVQQLRQQRLGGHRLQHWAPCALGTAVHRGGDVPEASVGLLDRFADPGRQHRARRTSARGRPESCAGGRGRRPGRALFSARRTTGRTARPERRHRGHEDNRNQVSSDSVGGDAAAPARIVQRLLEAAPRYAGEEESTLQVRVQGPAFSRRSAVARGAKSAGRR